mmetsp:Transcript_19988/g.68678  ORF Transcript_19988/g.68678 Transcript_19988/m.68678 type:complete len:160 (-) Transcript_19988:832-1311(-)
MHRGRWSVLHVQKSVVRAAGARGQHTFQKCAAQSSGRRACLGSGAKSFGVYAIYRSTPNDPVSRSLRMASLRCLIRCVRLRSRRRRCLRCSGNCAIRGHPGQPFVGHDPQRFRCSGGLELSRLAIAFSRMVSSPTEYIGQPAHLFDGQFVQRLAELEEI